MIKKILFLFFICFYLQAQETNPYFMYEFFIGTTNSSDNQKTVFNFNAVSDVFSYENGNINFSTDYLNSVYSVNGNSSLIMTNWKGLEFYSSNQYGLSVLAYGKYKITVDNGNSYFYFDLRDCNYPFNAYEGKHDIWFVYDVGNDRFFWSNEIQDTFNLFDNTWQFIQDSTIIGIWQIKNLIQNINCFVIPPKNITLSWENNYLKISWDRIDLENVESYYIYKKVEGCDEVLARIEPQANNATRQEWIDYSVTKPRRTDPMFKIDYRIRTRTIDEIFSNYSKRKSIYGNTGIWKKSFAEEEINRYELKQNTPNPFNPSTTISYQIPEASFVTLKVYDVLGREVATLVNEEKAAGTYNYQFSINNYQLTSGVFFYQLKTGIFSETKKMILLR